MLERMAKQIDRITSALDRQSGQAPPRSVEQPRLQIDRQHGHAILDGVRHDLDPVFLAILDSLVHANGNWCSQSDMQQADPLLRDDKRLDRLIKRLKRKHPMLGGLIESSSRGYHLSMP